MATGDQSIPRKNESPPDLQSNMFVNMGIHMVNSMPISISNTMPGQINNMGGPNGPYDYRSPSQSGVNVNTPGGSQQPMLVNTISQQREPPNMVMQGNRPGYHIGTNIGVGAVGNAGSIAGRGQATDQPPTQQSQQQQNFGATQQSSNSQVPTDKRKQIQQQLMLLLHAHKCTRQENENPNPNSMKCLVTHCRIMKEVLSHMRNCKLNKDCTVPHCLSSRQILMHWKHCIAADCGVCLPFRQLTSAPPNAQLLRM